ncbi:nucleoside-diphosphate-sugar epimerase [Nonomuraea polychroma]|uniref:Nucleoside-diphosphate-sugar epimerase n=2 Tax=Nonomuraea polychroma TaxID=46176 RepID=A0A438M891_9ACTN|nr:nucleoside-diphosphate-sugar epimerase [Nonomuraea polychroma]
MRTMIDRQEAVVVTGSAGRLGRAVVEHLAAAGVRVVGVDREAAPAPPGVRVHTMPVRDPGALRPVFRGARAVIHLAAMPNPRTGPGHTIYTTNTAATYAVLDAAAEEGVPRVVTASSGSMLGISGGPHDLSPLYAPLDEEHPARPQDGYALSKQADEAACAMFHRATGLSVAALRFPAIGTSGLLRERVLRERAEPGFLRRGLWAYVEVRDLARAFAAAVAADGIGWEVFAVAAGDTLSDVPTEELLRRHHPDTIIRRPLPGHTSVWDTGKAARMLGWRPEFTWREAEPVSA